MWPKDWDPEWPPSENAGLWEWGTCCGSGALTAKQELAVTHFPQGHPYQSEEAAWRAKDSTFVEGSTGAPVPALPLGKMWGDTCLSAGLGASEGRKPQGPGLEKGRQEAN